MRHETAEILVAAVTDHCNDYDFSTVYSDILGVFPHSSGANGNTGTGKCRLLHRSDQCLREKFYGIGSRGGLQRAGRPYAAKKHAENRILSEQYGTWRLGTDGRQRNSLSIRLEP